MAEGLWGALCQLPGTIPEMEMVAFIGDLAQTLHTLRVAFIGCFVLKTQYQRRVSLTSLNDRWGGGGWGVFWLVRFDVVFGVGRLCGGGEWGAGGGGGGGGRYCGWCDSMWSLACVGRQAWRSSLSLARVPPALKRYYVRLYGISLFIVGIRR